MLDLNTNEKSKEAIDRDPKSQELVERKEFLQENKEKTLKLEPEEIKAMRERIEKIEIGEDLEIDATKNSKELMLLDEEKKIKKLLDFARSKEKGVVYAVKVAQKMNDDFLLDKLHDTLLEHGLSEGF